MLKELEVRQNISELKNLNDKRKAKYRRNYRRYNFTPYASLDTIKDGSIVGYYGQNSSTDGDLTDLPQLNVIKSCIDTLVSKISQSKVRPFFNVQNGTFKDIQIVKNSQDFFDLYFDEQKVHSKVSDAFRDACIFDTGVIYIDEVAQTIDRALPWQVYVRPSEASYNKVSRAYYERTEYPTCLIDKYKGNAEYCSYAIYYDTKNKTKATFVDNELLKLETYDKEVLPFIFIHYNHPIYGNSSQSVVDMLNSIQLEINILTNKIKEASQLNAALTYWVPEGSTIKAGQLNNRIGNVVTYKPTPQMTSSPVTVSTPAMIDNQYINVLNDFIQKAYEMVGVTQLSAQGAKPVGVDSGIALQTLENVESERFECQLSNVISSYVDIAKTCIKVFDKSKDILPSDKNRVSIKWADVVKESDKMFIQYSAADNLSKDPQTKLQQLQALAQAQIIPTSRVAQLMEIPDIQSGYSLANNSVRAVMTVIDRCLGEDNFDVPDFVPFTMLKEEIMNTQLSLYSCGKNNDEDIEKLNRLYEVIEELESQLEPPADMGNMEMAMPNGMSNANPNEMPTEMPAEIPNDMMGQLTNNIEQTNNI